MLALDAIASEDLSAWRARECAACRGYYQVLRSLMSARGGDRPMVFFCPYCHKADLADAWSADDDVVVVDAVPAAFPRLVSAVRAAGGHIIDVPSRSTLSAPVTFKRSWMLTRFDFRCHPAQPVRVDPERAGHGVACPLCGVVHTRRRRAA
jgi:hypothetical protein